MSSLTLELLRDPELKRITEQAYSEVHAKAVEENRRYSRSEITDRTAILLDWRRRALKAESALRHRKKPSK